MTTNQDVAALREALEKVRDALHDCELNMSNYGEDDVSYLNQCATDAWQFADAALATDTTQPTTTEAPSVTRIEELAMTAFADAQPVRDECRGEQTILTYNENVGVYDLSFFESGWEFPERWLAASHWMDVTGMWPGVRAQVTEFNLQSQADLQTKLDEAVKHVRHLADWIEHEAGCDLPYSEDEPTARAFLNSMEVK